MAGGQWEVVGGKAKKSKGKNDVLKPSKEKKIKENAIFAASGPICESQTMFSAFQEEDKIPKPKVKVPEVIKEKEKPVVAKKRKDKKTSSSSKGKFEELIASVGVDDVLNLLAYLEQVYPEPSFLWLKDLVSFLNVRCDCSVEDPTFGTKPIGYPSTLLDKKVYALILKTFNRCKTQTLQLFYEQCVQDMIQDTLRGINTLGYRIILQCLAQEIPSIVLTKLPKCIELCDSHQNRQNICLSVFWAAGQAGNKNLEAGIRVWVDLMFRSLGTKCSNFAVDYLEKLLRKDVSCSKSLLTVQDLFPILDAVYSKELGKSIQKRLLALYPTLKALSYGPKPEDVVHNFFPSYLRRLEPNCPEALKKELVSSLVYCLEKDIRSYRIWRHIYTKHFIQSKLLISHINEEWGHNKLNRKWLLDTLSVFQVTNEEQLNSRKPSPVVEECMLVTKELLTKVNAHMFSWVRITLFFILIFSLMLGYDVWIHNSFIESNTGKLMKDSGMLVVFAHAGEKLLYYYEKIYKLLQVYAPVASKWTQQTISPYLELFFKLLSTFSAFLWTSSLEIRTWCSVNAHFIAMMVDKHFPVYSAKILSFLNDLLIILSSQFKIALVYMWHFGNTFITWLQSSDYIINFVDISQKYLLTGSAAVREYALSLLHLLQSYMT